MKCNQSGCLLDAVFEVFWPGKNPVPVYCPAHARRALDILHAMGVEAPIRRIGEKENESSD